MSTNFTNALEAEIQGLEAELEADPRFQKLRELKRVQSLYNGLPASVTIRHRTAPVISAPRRSGSPERKAILDRAKEYITGRDYPTTTAEIFEVLSFSIDIPGEKPKNNLSAMLSNSDEFVSHGRAGWTLASETREASGDLLTRSAPEASMSSPASPAGESPSMRPVNPVPGGGT